MQIDTTALLQGVYNARDNNHISKTLCDQISNVVRNISYPGPVGRKVCDYKDLLTGMASIDHDRQCVELSTLWGKYLGESLSSGIIVAFFTPQNHTNQSSSRTA